MNNHFLRSICLQNILSFGPDSPGLALHKLNVLIGPNGSGKSNLLECLALLRESPNKLELPIRDGGGMTEWLYKGHGSTKIAHLETVVDNLHGQQPLRHKLRMVLREPRFEVLEEYIENETAYQGQSNPYFYYRYSDGIATMNEREPERKRHLKREDLGPELSILNTIKDPDRYPEITYMGKAYGQIRIYREWSLGRFSPARIHQPADLPTDFLDEDYRNLGMVLNNLENRYPLVKDRIVESLRTLYPSVSDIKQKVVSGTVQVFLREGNMMIPATRLSDGTLRFLCLLTILLHPKPPRLICIEEPEVGLHPDVVGTLAELLLEASEHTQLIVTTHSVRLVDGLSDAPESVLVCEKQDQLTSIQRLNREELKPWLKDYSLGRLWTKGELGGNRW